MDGFVARSGPKRSRSFYDSVVENMLENMSNDISTNEHAVLASSTQYSHRRSKIRGEEESGIKSKVVVINADIDAADAVAADASADATTETVRQDISINSDKEEQKENLMPRLVSP